MVHGGTWANPRSLTKQVLERERVTQRVGRKKQKMKIHREDNMTCRM
jgi:hypothetical protein